MKYISHVSYHILFTCIGLYECMDNQQQNIKVCPQTVIATPFLVQFGDDNNDKPLGCVFFQNQSTSAVKIMKLFGENQTSWLSRIQLFKSNKKAQKFAF